MRLLPAWLLALGMCACANGAPPPSRYTVHMADPYPWASYYEGMGQAAAEWAAATGTPIEVRADGACGGPGDVCVHAVAVDWCKVGDCEAEGHQGGYTTVHADGSIDVSLAAGLAPDQVHAIELHELGHALGLEHVPDVAECMYPIVPTDVRVTPGDVRQFRAVHGGWL